MPKTRAFILAFCAGVMVPLPALAEESRVDDLAERLNDPLTQFAVAGMLSAFARMAMDLDIAPLVRAAEAMGDERARDLPPDARLGDLAGPNAERLPEDIAERVPGAMARMGTMAGAVSGKVPELQAMARRLRDALPQP